MSPCITLLTDFDDFYVSAMKGVILSRSTRHEIVDIYHAVPPQDVRAGAFILSNVVPYFPDGTVHCVVIDPGVGTDRRAVVVEAGDQYFVGPDNGVLVPPARRLVDDDTEFRVYNAPYENAESSTFHGRDVFAPLAVDVAENSFGFDESRLIDDYVDLEFKDPVFDDDEVRGEVIYVDRFGNVITNIGGEKVLEKTDFGSSVDVNGRVLPFERTYAKVGVGEPLCTIGSHENFEISVNQGSGSDELGLEAGDKVVVTLNS